MTDDPKTAAFEFDPLPGEQVPTLGTTTPSPKKRGRKPEATKPERKKRGPRRVQTAAEPLAPVAQTIVEHSTKTRKRRAKADPPELSFIQLLMHLSEKQRKRVLDVLNKIFA